jgi:hypothetical protein
MTGTSEPGEAYVVDIAGVFDDPGERGRLIKWGAEYIGSTAEDLAIRTAHLALEFAHLAWKRARSRRQRLSHWQVRLLTLAMITECVRANRLINTESDGHVRH